MTQASAEAVKTPAWQSYLGWAMAVIVVAGLGLVLWLLPHPELKSPRENATDGAVSVSEHGTIRILDGTPFQKRLVLRPAVAAQTEKPLIEVTGTVVAAVPPARFGEALGWQFASAELISTYAEWAQSHADVNFYRRQAATTKSLVETRVRTQGEVVGRLERLVEAGSDAPRDLALEKANLLERQLEADRQIHEAEASRLSAERRRDALERRLEQAGLSPDLLADPVPGRCYLVAEVPETRMAGLREGQACSVRFYADPEAHHYGHVKRILPTVSAAQRTLRVLVMLDSPEEAQRPGMFADVGIGTDLRQAVRIPPAAVVHIGHSDVVLWQEHPGEYRVVQVVLGTSDEGGVEVISGIQPGQILVADGAVLLKPLIADIVHAGVAQ